MILTLLCLSSELRLIEQYSKNKLPGSVVWIRINRGTVRRNWDVLCQYQAGLNPQFILKMNFSCFLNIRRQDSVWPTSLLWVYRFLHGYPIILPKDRAAHFGWLFCMGFKCWTLKISCWERTKHIQCAGVLKTTPGSQEKCCMCRMHVQYIHILCN